VPETFLVIEQAAPSSAQCHAHGPVPCSRSRLPRAANETTRRASQHATEAGRPPAPETAVPRAAIEPSRGAALRRSRPNRAFRTAAVGLHAAVVRTCAVPPPRGDPIRPIGRRRCGCRRRRNSLGFAMRNRSAPCAAARQCAGTPLAAAAAARPHHVLGHVGTPPGESILGELQCSVFHFPPLPLQRTAPHRPGVSRTASTLCSAALHAH
jgi:hypothetical protein